MWGEYVQLTLITCRGGELSHVGDGGNCPMWGRGEIVPCGGRIFPCGGGELSPRRKILYKKVSRPFHALHAIPRLCQSDTTHVKYSLLVTRTVHCTSRTVHCTVYIAYCTLLQCKGSGFFKLSRILVLKKYPKTYFYR